MRGRGEQPPFFFGHFFALFEEAYRAVRVTCRTGYACATHPYAFDSDSLAPATLHIHDWTSFLIRSRNLIANLDLGCLGVWVRSSKLNLLSFFQ